MTEDAIVGSAARSFSINLPAGEYSVYVLCGISYNLRYQYFDFDVAIGDDIRRARFEGPYHFRNLRFSVATDGKPLQIGFGPASKWVCNAIMVWDETDGDVDMQDLARRKWEERARVMGILE